VSANKNEPETAVGLRLFGGADCRMLLIAEAPKGCVIYGSMNFSARHRARASTEAAPFILLLLLLFLFYFCFYFLFHFHFYFYFYFYFYSTSVSTSISSSASGGGAGPVKGRRRERVQSGRFTSETSGSAVKHLMRAVSMAITK
jgi:hypothetical protein